MATVTNGLIFSRNSTVEATANCKLRFDGSQPHHTEDCRWVSCKDLADDCEKAVGYLQVFGEGQGVTAEVEITIKDPSKMGRVYVKTIVQKGSVQAIVDTLRAQHLALQT